MNLTSFSHFSRLMPLCALFALSITSCGNKKAADSGSSSESATASAEFKADSIAWHDSITAPHGCKALCSISVDYPTSGNETLVNNIRTWIATQLATDNSITDGVTPLFKVSETNLTDGKKFIAEAGKLVLEKARPDLLSMDSLGINPDMSFTYDWKISDIYQTDKFVTYASSTYCYLGGAHGGSAFNPQVFSLADGAEFGWNMFRTDAIPALKQMIKEGLMTQQFEVKTEKEFRECLLVNPDTLPLPVTPPYFSANGVNFVYQQYEITPYSAGMPGCSFPYDKMRPMLTEAAAALLPD